MISRNPSIVWTKLEGKAVLLNVELGRYYEANAVGSLIWELLDEPCTIADIVERIVARFRVDREQCQADVLNFLEALAESGLLARKEAAPEGASDLARSSSE